MAHLTWNNTELKNASRTKLSVKEIKHLFENRGCCRVQGKKADLIKLLKSKYSVRVDQGFWFDQMKVKDLMIELKLLGIDPELFNSKLKGVLIFLLQTIYQAPNMRWKVINNQYKMYSKPMNINKNEYVTVGQASLLKYDINKNKWSKWINSYLIPYHYGDVALCVDNRQKTIYVMGRKKLLTINYANAKVENTDIIINDNDDIGLTEIKQTKLILIDNELHIICYGREEDSHYLKKYRVVHYIFNVETRKLIQVHIFDNFGGAYNYNYRPKAMDIVYLSSQKRMLLFELWGQNNARSYCCKTKKWTVLKHKIPGNSLSNCLITTDERFIILMAKHQGKIFIANTTEWKFKESVVHCPTIDFDAIIADDQFKKELVTAGFIRNVYKKYKIGMSGFPPQYLIKLIEARFNFDNYLHLFINNCCSHFCIPLEHVMKEKSD